MEEFNRQEALRLIPPTNEILERQDVMVLVERIGRNQVLELLRQIIEEYRRSIRIKQQTAEGAEFDTRESVAVDIVKKLSLKSEEYIRAGIRRVINATGIVLHTNLGRAPLPTKALSLMIQASEGYSNLEFDLENGSRGSRNSRIESLISSITGSESAIAVNNNAAAVFLCLNTLACGKEVIISRGQQVEIGGSFRIPDIISRSGARMVEVGTTNKTRLDDYSAAIGPDTSVLLKVHTSNYKVTGYAEEVPLQEMVSLGKEKEIIVMEDLGSGSLYDLSNIGLPYERTVQDSIKAGADIVAFSGDKLLGGPQAGIIAGKKILIDKIRKSPLARIVRCDKTTIAALEAVLSLYKDLNTSVEQIPVLRMMAMQEKDLLEHARELKESIDNTLGDKCRAEVVDDSDEVGGGSLPGVVLKGKAVALKAEHMGASELQTLLRRGENPVVCRISMERILLNVRTIEKKDFPAVVKSLAGILG